MSWRLITRGTQFSVVFKNGGKVYNIDSLRISLHQLNTSIYSDRVSVLFNRKLKDLIDRVFTRTLPAGVSARLGSPLVLKLGDIPGAFFENIFCRRFERALEQALRQLLMERGELWVRDSPEQCRVLLIQTLRSGDESADIWLARQLELAPDIWLPVLVAFALLPEGAMLYRQLKEETVRKLCNQLVPGIPPEGDITGDSLWLSALLYLYDHPELPVPPAPGTTQPGVPPELKVTVSSRDHDLRLIRDLFERPKPDSPSLLTWFQALWKNQTVIDSVRPLLSTERIKQLHHQLGLQQAQSSKSGNRKSDSTSKEQWHPLDCAGMVLLWPMLPGVFRHLKLLDGKRFASLKVQRRAAGCLVWLALRQTAPPAEATFCQLLCGLPLEEEITSEDMPDDVTCEQLQQWLTDLPALLPPTWQKLSAEDIRQWFLLRPGWISSEPGQNRLRVKPEAFDVLLNAWSWPVNVVPLPWFEKPLTVSWSDN